MIGCVQSALLTSVAWYGPGSKSSSLVSCTLMHSTLWRSVSSSSRLRSSLRPPGSPTMPVAPPASGNGRWPASWKRRMNSWPTRWPTCSESAVGSKPMYSPIVALGETRRQSIAIGGVVDESAGVEFGQEIQTVVHAAPMLPAALSRNRTSASGESARAIAAAGLLPW